jgi:hypothetical protein
MFSRAQICLKKLKFLRGSRALAAYATEVCKYRQNNCGNYSGAAIEIGSNDIALLNYFLNLIKTNLANIRIIFYVLEYSE